jgi:hypothetical protein
MNGYTGPQVVLSRDELRFLYTKLDVNGDEHARSILRKIEIALHADPKLIEPDE